MKILNEKLNFIFDINFVFYTEKINNKTLIYILYILYKKKK